MSDKKISASKIVWRLILIGFGFGVVAYGSYVWQENKAMDEMVSPGLRLINYTNDEVYTSVRNSKFPNPGEGASYDMGPNTGGAGIMCCVPIPARWRPGIKMNVTYRFGKWPAGREEMRVVELPQYPDGRPGSLYLVIHSENEFELLSSIYAPGHPRWPGKQVEPVDEGLK